MRLDRIQFIGSEVFGQYRANQSMRPTQSTVDAWDMADDYAAMRGRGPGGGPLGLTPRALLSYRFAFVWSVSACYRHSVLASAI